ncbi:MAG: N-6 DNA methylase, partial [Euryarchaeota archaeon]|nr:N-6 DNA methylase [Euryarchaeota archaeon]
ELINVGSEAIGEKEFHVPAYNGGLFDTKKNPELDEKWKIGDKYLAEAIHLLTWSEINGAGFVDYSELEIRHLGSIYEGLLEYKLKVAEADIVTKENEWVSLEKYNEGRKQKKTFEQFDEFSRARKGELYLATDKGERKATGSYYTPDYIVNYIVRNTLEPVVEERWKEDEAKNQSFMEATLSVKVLDPAMGSGHFLVGAVDFLAEKLLNAAQKDIEAGRLREDERFSDLDWARREVVAHCIYGVDLNPMAVELAKVSLWLKTISREKPLSFLDHRLKQGNSLIGAQLEDLPYYPDVKRKKKEKKVKDAAQQTFEVEIERPFFDKIVKILNSLTDINDDSIENINKKKDIFEKLIASPEYQRIKALANLHTAVYFGVETTKVDRQPKDGYNDILWALRDNEEEWRKKTNREWFGKARRLAEEKSFFHWELEFPELFFEGGAPKEAPGWDAVVGNPPYDVLSAKERGEEEEKLQYELDYFKGQISGFSGKLNLYRLMSERSYSYLRDSGRFGFIIPNTVMADQSSAPLRKFLFENSKEISFLEFPEKARVFTDVTQAVCIVVAQKGTPKAEEIFLASGLKTGSDLLAPKFFNLKLKEILEIDGEYYLPYVSEKSIDLFRKLLNFPRTGNLNDLSIFQGKVNLTNYKECIKTNDGAQLIRGDHLSRYELIFNTEKPSYLDVQCYLTKAGDAEKAKHHKSQRVAFQEVANMQLSRRLNATLIEQNQFLGHTTNYFIVKIVKESISGKTSNTIKYN